MRKAGFIFIFLLTLSGGYAQEDAAPKWQLTGYLKGLQSLYGFNQSYPDFSNGKLDLVDTFLVDNLIKLMYKFYKHLFQHVHVFDKSVQKIIMFWPTKINTHLSYHKYSYMHHL